jgi:VanZ family protein
MRWVRLWWPALAWAVAISWFSTGTFTAENTGRFIIPTLHWLFPSLSPDMLALLHHLIRKSAHFVEYFVLSLLVLRGLRAGRKETHIRWALAAVLVVAGYAAIDEFHQSFVPGRTAAVADVLLDSSGGVAAQLMAGLVFLWADVRKKRREREAVRAAGPSAAAANPEA